MLWLARSPSWKRSRSASVQLPVWSEMSLAALRASSPNLTPKPIAITPTPAVASPAIRSLLDDRGAGSSTGPGEPSGGESEDPAGGGSGGVGGDVSPDPAPGVGGGPVSVTGGS